MTIDTKYDHWKLTQVKDKWGRRTGNPIAMSEPQTSKVQGLGDRLCLALFHHTKKDAVVAYIQGLSGQMGLRFGADSEPYPSLTCYEIEVKVGREEMKWRMLYDPATLRLLSDDLDCESVRDLWAKELSFDLILPTEKWGDLPYGFNMKGTKASIQEIDKIIYGWGEIPK